MTEDRDEIMRTFAELQANFQSTGLANVQIPDPNSVVSSTLAHVQVLALTYLL
jgi:hypothetical protein